MLVLSRNVGETIVMDNGVEITLLETQRGKARIGIHAPRDVSVVRGELLVNGKFLEWRKRMERREHDSEL